MDKSYVLRKIACCEPQTAYSGFIKGFRHKPIYFMRTILNIKNQLRKLNDVIRTGFILAITGEMNYSDNEKRQMSLPSSLEALKFPGFQGLHRRNTSSQPYYQRICSTPFRRL